VGDVNNLLRAGADKISINTAAITRPELISEIVDRFGSQVLVLSVDARRANTPSGFEVTTHGGRESAGLDALAWVEKACALGVGEILLNSMDADGTRAGYDIGMIKAVRQVANVPLIASGGAGVLSDFAAALDAGADALLAASVFHFGIHRIGDVKRYLSQQGYSVRTSALA
jgi:cyclase